jgi:hypothetical protein
MMQATDALEASYDAAAGKRSRRTARRRTRTKTELLATTDAGRANREALLGIADADDESLSGDARPDA